MRSTVTRLAGLLLALALLMVPLVALAQPGPRITVSPSSGPPGTNFMISGTGFAPNTSVLCAAADPGRKEVVAALIPITPAGALQASVDSTGYAPGEYTVTAYTDDRRSVLATATFTVTLGGGPAAPRTGAGSMAAGGGPAYPIVAGLALLALAALATIAARRRAA